MDLLSLEDTSVGAWQALSSRAQPAFAGPGYLAYAFPPFRSPLSPGSAYAVLVMAWTPAPDGELSNHAYSPFSLKGRTWPSVEHYFQAAKFMTTDPAHAERIMRAPDPDTALGLGRDRSHPVAAGWDAARDGVMLEALEAKFGQNPAIAAALLQAPAAIGEEQHLSADPYWGSGGRAGGGKNVLGGLLSRVRAGTMLPPFPGPVELVTLKITTSSAELSAPPPGGSPASPGEHPMLGPLEAIVATLFRRRLLGPPVVTYPPKRPEPTIHFPCAHPAEPDRMETVAVQVFRTPVEAGKAGRSPFQQAVLEGLSEARKAVSKDKMLPASGPPAPGRAELFAVEAHDALVEAALESLEPMLAQDGKTPEGVAAALGKRGVSEVFFQPKLDGLRLLCSRRGDGVAMVTRQGTTHRISEILGAEIVPYLDGLERELGPGVVLDGELYVHRVPAEIEICVSLSDKEWTTQRGGRPLPKAWAGPLVPTQLGKITGAASSLQRGGGRSVATERNRALLEVLEYHVFTYFRPGDRSPALERHKLLARHLPLDTLGAAHYAETEDGRYAHAGGRVWLVPAAPGRVGEVESYARHVKGFEYEGAMIYSAGAPYRHGRTWDLVKLKGTETEWFLVTGAAPEEGSPTANILYRYGDRDYVASGFFSYAAKRKFYDMGGSLRGLYAYIRFQKVTQSTAGGGALRDPKVLYLSRTSGGAPVDAETL